MVCVQIELEALADSMPTGGWLSAVFNGSVFTDFILKMSQQKSKLSENL
jgi:hypothetical protein